MTKFVSNLKEHLESRHVDLTLHSPLLEEKEVWAYFFLYNLSGQLTGYQKYNPNGDKKVFNDPKFGRYYTYGSLPTVRMFGMETLHLTPKVVFLTEGVFDACRLTQRGVSCLASLCNNPPKDYKNFLQLLNRKVVVVRDHGTPGAKLAKFGDYVELPPEGEDLGSAPDEYVDSLLDKYSYLL